MSESKGREREEQPGSLVISFDFELFWGVRDKLTKEEYGERILGGRKAILQLLAIFKEFGVHSTFFTVGFLFHQDKQQLLSNIPKVKPSYVDQSLTPYGAYLETIGGSEEEDPYHYGYSILQKIKDSKEHEIASHTFSHYYCVEDGQTGAEFRADLLSAKRSAEEMGVSLRTIAFPRNQVNETYLSVCNELGFKAYRGCENSWVYAPRADHDERLGRRLVRLADAYVNLTGHHTVSYEDASKGVPFNITSSRFLRPYIRKLSCLDGLRIQRITRGMTHAAKNGEIYHLWWHPHNFGMDMDKNIVILRKILKHYAKLHEQYGFTSRSMEDCAGLIEKMNYG